MNPLCEKSHVTYGEDIWWNRGEPGTQSSGFHPSFTFHLELAALLSE